MGLLIHDKIDPGIGIEMTDTYASFHGQEVRIQPITDESGKRWFNVSSRYLIYKNKEAIENGLKPVQAMLIRTRTDGDGITNVYTTLYTELAKKFSSTDNC